MNYRRSDGVFRLTCYVFGRVRQLRREGKLVAGYMSYSSVAVMDGETRPFSVENTFGDDVPEHDGFDIYIIPNLL